jgi:hypothetical protein
VAKWVVVEQAEEMRVEAEGSVGCGVGGGTGCGAGGEMDEALRGG